MKKASVMIVEDDRVLIEYLKDTLEESGFKIGRVVQSGEEAVTSMDVKIPDLILMDILLEGKMNGLDAAKAIRQHHDIPIVFLTSHENNEMIQQAKSAGAYGYLLKPFDHRLLRVTVEMALSRHHMEQQLKENEERYRSIIEELEEGYYESDIAGNITFANDAMSRIIGIPKTELIGMNNRDFMDPETAKTAYRIYNEVFSSGTPVKEFFYEAKSRDGRSRDLDLFITLKKNKGGTPTGFKGIVRDITERRRTEIQLVKTRNFLQNILNSSIDGITTTDMKGRVVYATPKLLEMLGYEQKSMIGKRVSTFYKNGKEDARQIMRQLMEKGEIKIREMQFLRSDGEPIDVILSASLLKDESGKTVGTLGIFKDITD
ncbi:MAG: PAS domain S-box protein, partial [Thermodesulfobacteriota bacterium]